MTDRTIYVGGLYERVTSAGGLIEHKHYIMGPTGRIAVFTDRSNVSNDTRWFHTDGLGSITVISDEAGRVLKRYTYDAWGKQTTAYTNTGSGITNQAPSTRGFTDHEMLSDFWLIHMNGRVYDPVLGRFLSADPNVDGAHDAQGYNRYSYVSNNPMNATDPSGYFSLKDALKIVAIVVAGVITAGAALYAIGASSSLWGGMLMAVGANGGVAAAAAAAHIAGWQAAAIIGAGMGFGSGFAGSLLNGGSIGDAFKAGLVGAVVGGITAGITHGIGTYAKNHKWDWFKTSLAHGAAQGGITEAAGGEFRHGFYSGFFSSAAAGPISNTIGGGAPGQTIASAIVGGTASAIGGGKFANGAISGAFTYLFNRLGHSDGKIKALVALTEDAANDTAISEDGEILGKMEKVVRDRFGALNTSEVEFTVKVVSDIRQLELFANEYDVIHVWGHGDELGMRFSGNAFFSKNSYWDVDKGSTRWKAALLAGAPAEHLLSKDRNLKALATYLQDTYRTKLVTWHCEEHSISGEGIIQGIVQRTK